MTSKAPHPVDVEFPFDPTLRGQERHYRGLEKLRCFDDRVAAARLYDVAKNVDAAQAERQRRAPPQLQIPWDQKPRRECLDTNTDDEKDKRYP